MKYIHTKEEAQRLAAQSAAVRGAEVSLLGRLVQTRPARILDVGCGPGASALTLKAAFPGAVLSGIEADPDAAQKARDSGHYEKVYTGSIPDAPLPPSPFDLVYSRLLLRHTEDPSAAVAWMWQAAAPGGRLVLADADDATLLFHPHQPVIADTVERARNALVNQTRHPHPTTSGRTLPSLLAGMNATDPMDAALTLTTSGNLYVLPSLAMPMLQWGCTTAAHQQALEQALSTWRAAPGAMAAWTLFYAAGTRP